MNIRYAYDPVRAEQLLEQAGWLKGSDGIRARVSQRLSFTLWTIAGHTILEQYATVMQQQWKSVSVDMTPKTEDFQSLVTRISETHDFEAVLLGFGWGVDPDQTTLWASDSYPKGSNYNRYSNAQVDALLRRGFGEPDPAMRKQIYVDMQNILMDEMPTLVFDFPQGIAGVNTRVHNLLPNAINFHWNAHTFWVDDGR